jgi:heptosyltransferase-2
MVSSSPPLFHDGVPASLAVVQPLPGIGDMIWHLPHIRALAAAAGRPVTLITKPRSAADQILANEPAVADIVWMDRNPAGRRGAHDGPIGFLRFVSALRARRFDAIVILHHSHSLAVAALLAGIPARYGYGSAAQRWLLNRRPFLSPTDQRLHPFDQASAWLRVAGIPQAEAEPELRVPVTARAEVRQRLGAPSGPIVAIGAGSSEPYKQWGAANFAALAEGLLAAGWNHLVLVGGSTEAALIGEVLHHLRPREGAVRSAIGWKLTDVAALCAEAAFYVGNDTGVLNIAAAVGIPAYGLFGGWPPLRHSQRIIPVLPPDGRTDKTTGMARITPACVLAAIAASTTSAREQVPLQRAGSGDTQEGNLGVIGQRDRGIAAG